MLIIVDLGGDTCDDDVVVECIDEDGWLSLFAIDAFVVGDEPSAAAYEERSSLDDKSFSSEVLETEDLRDQNGMV